MTVRPENTATLESPASTSQDTTFAISAVAKLTGISEHCLRIWERRYNVVEPARTETKRRRYTQHDVERLVLIKHLVDAGDTISAVAPLGLEQLKERAKQYPTAAQYDIGDVTRKIRVIFIGERLPSTVQPEEAKEERLEVVGTFRSIAEFSEATSRAGAEVIVFDFATLHLQTLSDMERVMRVSGARKGILVYGFAARPALERLNRERFVPLRAPVDLHEIRIACADPHMAAATHETAPEDGQRLEFIPHRYDVDDLAKIASYASKVKCECPHHLVSLVFSLNAFERYSLECESVNREDAELHNYLHKMTSKARAIIEEALAKVAKADGIEL